MRGGAAALATAATVMIHVQGEIAASLDRTRVSGGTRRRRGGPGAISDRSTAKRDSNKKYR